MGRRLDGPTATSADEIRRGRNTLSELAEAAGRDPDTVQIMAFGHAGHFKSREAVLETIDAGADRVTIWLDQTEGEGALAEMDEIARQISGLTPKRRLAPVRRPSHFHPDASAALPPWRQITAGNTASRACPSAAGRS